MYLRYVGFILYWLPSGVLLVIANKPKGEGVFARPPSVFCSLQKHYPFFFSGMSVSKIYYYASFYIAVASVALC